MRHALIGVAVTVALTIGPASGARGVPDGFGGVNAQGVFWGPHKQWNPSLAAMAAGGIKTVRFDATWATAEPTRGCRRCRSARSRSGTRRTRRRSGAPPRTSADAALETVVRLRHGLAALGSPEAPIVVSEFGWMTSGHRAVSEAWRARQVVALTLALARSDCNVGAVQLHTWVRPQPHGDPGDGYGIVGADGRQTATAVDYLATLRAIDDGSVGPPGADQPCWGPGLPDFGEL